MTATDRIVDQLARIPVVRSETAVFVRMDGAFAVVNIGTSTVSVPCVGFYPPVVGMTVQVEWRDGRPVVTGPARALSPVGQITGTGTPRATVTVDGVAYLLFIRSGYTPVLGHTVTVNWATGVIEGQVTGINTPTPPVEGGAGSAPFSDLVVRAANSGRYQTAWWGNDPWASSNNSGIWTYLSRNRDALAGANVTGVEVYLPLRQQVGAASIGLHSYSSIPGGAPSISSLVALPLGGRSGWVRLPEGWGNFLRDNDGGVGVLAPGGGGYTIWAGTAADSLSGALRFAGTR